MADSDFIPSLMIGIIVMVVFAVGLSFSFMDFSERYDISRSSLDVKSQEAFDDMNELTDTISGNVDETGITDESSNSKIISVGWNSLKLASRTPSILSTYLQSLDALNFSVANIDFVNLALTIISVLIFMTLIYMIFLGRAG